MFPTDSFHLLISDFILSSTFFAIFFTSYLCNLPEVVKARVRRASEFKLGSKCAARNAELYARIRHLNFIEKYLLGTFLLKTLEQEYKFGI